MNDKNWREQVQYALKKKINKDGIPYVYVYIYKNQINK